MTRKTFERGEARRIPAAIRWAFEAGYGVGLERGHDTSAVRCEVTDEIVRGDLETRERALQSYFASRRIRKRSR